LNLLKAADGCFELHPVLSCAFGPVQGTVGRGEELPHVASGPVLGDAEAAGDGHRFPVAARKRALREGLADTIGEKCAARRVGSGQKEEELLAAPAAGEVGLAEALAEDGRELAQNEIAATAITPE